MLYSIQTPIQKKQNSDLQMLLQGVKEIGSVLLSFGMMNCIVNFAVILISEV